MPDERVPSGQSWNNLNNEIHREVMDYRPKYKINMHESVLQSKVTGHDKFSSLSDQTFVLQPISLFSLCYSLI